MKNLNKKSIIYSIIILVGLVLSVYGALNYQNLLSHAGSTDYTSFQVKDGKGNILTPHDGGAYDTQSLDVELKINNLEQLSQ